MMELLELNHSCCIRRMSLLLVGKPDVKQLSQPAGKPEPELRVVPASEHILCMCKEPAQKPA